MYHCGDKVKYTGNSEFKHGCLWFELLILDGAKKGSLCVTSKCPDCGLKFGQDQPAADVCQTCDTETAKFRKAGFDLFKG